MGGAALSGKELGLGDGAALLSLLGGAGGLWPEGDGEGAGLLLFPGGDCELSGDESLPDDELAYGAEGGEGVLHDDEVV